MENIAVFCGSSLGKEKYVSMALEVADSLYLHKKRLIYGGAKVGLMGLLADRILSKGGEVIGYMPKFFSQAEVVHQNLTELVYVETMSERKLRMVEKSDAFLILPGSYGTLDEAFEVLVLLQLDVVRKPICFYNYQGFYDTLFQYFDHIQAEGFMKTCHRDMFLWGSTMEECLQKMEAWKYDADQAFLRKIKR